MGYCREDYNRKSVVAGGGGGVGVGMRGERGEGVKKAGTALREVGQCEWVLCALFHFSGAFHGAFASAYRWCIPCKKKGS